MPIRVVAPTDYVAVVTKAAGVETGCCLWIQSVHSHGSEDSTFAHQASPANGDAVCAQAASMSSTICKISINVVATGCLWM